MTGKRASFGMLSLWMSLGMLSAPAKAEDMVRYTVKRGDTFEGLAREHFFRLADWTSVARANRVADPRRLRTGQVLAIPTRYLRYRPIAANLTAYRGDLSLKPGGPPRVGISLAEGTQIATGAGAFASLSIAGMGNVTLPSLTAVRIDRLRRYSLGDTVERTLTLLRGRVDVRAQPAGSGTGSRALEIRSKRATAAIRGTEFSLAANDANDTLSVFEGTVAFVATGLDPDGPPATAANTAVALVPAGYGAAAVDRAISALQTLLPSPSLREPARLRTEAAMRLEAEPVPGAAKYRFGIGLDARLIEMIAEQDSATAAVAIPDLPDGKLYVRVSAISASGIEGQQRTYTVRRQSAEVTASASRDDDGTLRFRWTRTGGANGAPVRLVLAADPALDRPLIDLFTVRDELAVSGIAPGSYWWTVEQRLVTDNGIERVRAPILELVVS